MLKRQKEGPLGHRFPPVLLDPTFIQHLSFNQRCSPCRQLRHRSKIGLSNSAPSYRKHRSDKLNSGRSGVHSDNLSSQTPNVMRPHTRRQTMLGGTRGPSLLGARLRLVAASPAPWPSSSGLPSVRSTLLFMPIVIGFSQTNQVQLRNARHCSTTSQLRSPSSPSSSSKTSPH